MTRFVTGEEITEICGAIAETFVKERNLMTGVAAGGIAAGIKGAAKKGKVTVDDTVLFLARFSGGAVASFEAARQATGNQNRNGFEINGTKGALHFDFERMNELMFYDATAPRRRRAGPTSWSRTAGTIRTCRRGGPMRSLIGYEHGFVHQAYDVLRVLAGQEPTIPLPDFEDAYQTQRVLEAALISAGKKRWVKMASVK